MNWSRILVSLAVLGCGLIAVAADAQEKKAAPAPPKPPAGVEYLPDIEYGTGGGEKLRLDLAKPAKLERAAPCILVIHGGAWAGGDKKQHTDLIFKLAEK